MYVLETYQTVLLYTQFLLLNNRKVKKRGERKKLEESLPRAGHRANREIGRSCVRVSPIEIISLSGVRFFVLANGGV